MGRPAHRPPNKPFESDEALLSFSLGVLADSGLDPGQVHALRERTNKDIFTKEVVGQRRFATSVLLSAGLSNEQIAKVFKQSKQTVAADREHIRRVYTDSVLQNADHWRARLIEEQDALKKKALDAFEKSRKRVVKRVQERNGDEVVTTEVHESAGESSFLNVAKGCLEQQARLLGLHDSKPQVDESDKTYKSFLENLSKEVKKIKEAEKNAEDRSSAIEASASAEFDDNGEPAGKSRPILPMDDDD